MISTTQNFVLAAMFVLSLTASAAELRPLSADRPDSTESPQTVDKGHFQLETDIAAYVGDGAARGWAFLVTNFKAGLTDYLDVQLVVTPYLRESGGPRGFGDIQVRVKINVWGNDEGETALAVMPFLTFPTADDGLGVEDVEGGVIVPFATSFGEWGFGAQIEVDIVNEEGGSGMTADFIVTVVLGHTIHGDLSGFVEIFSIVTGEDDRWGGTANAGLTYLIDANTQVDAGVRVGITTEDENYVLFFGVTRRF